MGIIQKGILGPFSGKVGTVVGSTWKGVPVIRSKQSSRKGSPTELQLAQQVKFTTMIKFLQPLSSLLNQTYDKIAVGMSGFNKAFSYNIMNGLSGNYPDITINYPLILIGRGDLPNVGNAAAVSTTAGKLTANWTDNSGLGKAKATDLIFVAAYSEELKHWIYNMDTTARSGGTYTVDTLMFSGKPVHVYVGFVSADGKLASNSFYAGLINIL